jgi:PhnB protein
MTQAIAYLSFDGTCAEAMRFYEQAIGGKLELMMSGADSPMAEQIPADCRDRIIHARLALPGGGTLYAGDAPLHMKYQGIHGVGITLDFDTVDRARQVFDALSQGGQVTMPMQAAFWAKAWGMATDRFGVPWIVNGEQIPI